MTATADETEVHPAPIEAVLAMVARTCGVRRDDVRLIGPDLGAVAQGSDGASDASVYRLRVQTGADLTGAQRESLDALGQVLHLLLQTKQQPADSFMTQIEMAVAGPMRELEEAVDDLQRLSLSGRPARYAASIVAATARLRERTTSPRYDDAASRDGEAGQPHGGAR